MPALELEIFESYICDGRLKTRPAGRFFQLMAQKQFPEVSTLLGPILDLGCGNGEFMFLLGGQPNSIVGVDPNPVALGAAKETFQYLATHTKLDDSLLEFSAIICNSVLEHTDDPASILKEMSCRAAASGRLYMTVPLANWHRGTLAGILGDLDYCRHLDERFNHVHMLEEEEWIATVEAAGFVVRHSSRYMSRTAYLYADLLLRRPEVLPHILPDLYRLYLADDVLCRSAAEERGGSVFIMAEKQECERNDTPSS